MAEKIKKLLCLLLTVTMVGALFVGCGGAAEEQEKITLQPMDDETQITLSYAYWEDNYIVDSLVEGWSLVHPNATVSAEMTDDLTTHNQKIINLAASRQVPDVYWVLGSPENMINKGLLYDMSGMWDADEDTKNLIGGINEFELGKFGTDGKWTTPVKFFPTVMFLNLTTFATNNYAMPSTDWTWDEFDQVVRDMTHDKYFGISEACTVITLYPIANDPDCIGEFGWDGTSFDLTDWADGMEYEKTYIQRGYKAPVPGTEDGDAKILELYGSAIQPQDEGYVAIRTDHWWCWERFWNDSSFYSKNTFFVPYCIPHTEENASSKNMFATIDFGAISSMSENKLAAYYLLKYMTWGADGWNWRLDHYQEIRETGIIANGGDINNFEAGGLDNTDGCEVINNCPITLDAEVWAKYEALHPNLATPDPIADRLVAAGLSATARAEIFDAFWPKVKSGLWTCYGSQQIPGFDSFLYEYYFVNDFGGVGATGIEDAYFNHDVEASEYVQDLTDKANELAQEYLDALNSQIAK